MLIENSEKRVMTKTSCKGEIELMANAAKTTKRTIITVDSGKFMTKAVRRENGKIVKKFEVSTKINPTTEKISTSRS